MSITPGRVCHTNVLQTPGAGLSVGPASQSQLPSHRATSPATQQHLCGAGCEHQTARLLLLLLLTPGRKESLRCESELCQRPICTKKPKDSQVQRRGYRSWARGPVPQNPANSPTELQPEMGVRTPLLSHAVLGPAYWVLGRQAGPEPAESSAQPHS